MYKYTGLLHFKTFIIMNIFPCHENINFLWLHSIPIYMRISNLLKLCYFHFGTIIFNTVVFVFLQTFWL